MAWVKKMGRGVLLLPLVLAFSCRQVVNLVNVKQLSPEVVRMGQDAGGWYTYMPEYAPHFCLRTLYSIAWHDPAMQLGYWKLRHPEPPHRIIMEARGDTLYIHRGFVWDGISFGNTVPAELVPSLLHDALYYARQADAPVSREMADDVFLRACEQFGCSGKYAGYLGVRAFGGFFGKPDGVLAPRLELSSRETPMSPLPAGESRFISLQP